MEFIYGNVQIMNLSFHAFCDRNFVFSMMQLLHTQSAFRLMSIKLGEWLEIH